jgi:hypothetical protein
MVLASAARGGLQDLYQGVTGLIEGITTAMPLYYRLPTTSLSSALV